MTIFCYGSINIDHVHTVPHFPQPGETLSDTSYQVHLGGKGANQALAARAAGATVEMIGAVGHDGEWALSKLAAAGIGLSTVPVVEAATGHAVIFVTPDGENQIVIHGGANRQLDLQSASNALTHAQKGDWWLCQNETNSVAEAAKAARAAGMKVAYAAAPFGADATAAVLPHADLLAVNSGEAAALAGHLGCPIEEILVPILLVTEGATGAYVISEGERVSIDAFPVTAVDTTGAGDTFLGTFLAWLDQGHNFAEALRRAAAAAAVQVTRPGAGDAIPSATEVDEFLRDNA
ncbi:MAG: PfkB family carbohydrate kinase [Pseudomonadota bacterium]